MDTLLKEILDLITKIQEQIALLEASQPQGNRSPAVTQAILEKKFLLGDLTKIRLTCELVMNMNAVIEKFRQS